MASSAPAQLEEAARRICDRLRDAGFRVLWAGGCVRDRLLNRPAKDIDIVTNAAPEDIERLFDPVRHVGRSFGVMLVKEGEWWFQVAQFRRDRAYKDGRRPSGVEPADEITDAQRRDFTINGMFYDPFEDRVLDYVGGLDDLQRRRIRTIGSPDDRFAEDHLRMLRAVRFAATLEFEIEPATADAIRRLAPNIRRIAAERIQEELNRILTESARPGQAVRLLRDVGLLAEILPEVNAMVGVKQSPDFHPEGDVFQHTVAMLDRLRHPSLDLALAVLLHDVGKPVVARQTVGEGHVRGHEVVGAGVAEAVLQRLRYPNRLRDAVVECVRNHMRYHDIPSMRVGRLRYWMRQPGFDLGLEVHRLDMEVRGQPCHACQKVEELRRQPVVARRRINGHDVISLGVPPGPQVARWLSVATEYQLEHPQARRPEVLAWLKQQIQASQLSSSPESRP